MRHSSESINKSGQQLQRINIAFLSLAWLFVLLRVWTRTRIISNFGWDDSTMILATMIFTLYCGAQLYMEANGGGTHITSVSHLQMLVKWVVVGEVAYCAMMMTLKVSLGIYFTRIVAKRWQLILIYCTVGVNIFSSVAALFYAIFRCGPNLDAYMIQQISGRCTPRKLDSFMAYQQAGFTTLTDLVFVILPIPILWSSNMHRRSKFTVGFILSLGALGCICSMIRFKYIDGVTQTKDFFWNAVNISIWSTIEAGMSITAGCLATLRPFLRWIAAKVRSSTSPLRSYVQEVATSLSSSSKSTSGHGELPRYNTAASSKKDASDDTDMTELTSIKFPMSSSQLFSMSSDVGSKRESTDGIL